MRGPGQIAVAAVLVVMLPHSEALAERTAPVPVPRPVTEAAPAPRTAADRLPVPIRRPAVPRDALANNRVVPPARGALLCKDPRLSGTLQPDVVGQIPGCGIHRPVRLTAISGIKLTTPAVLDCRTARTFANWLTGVANVEAGKTLGARISKVWLMGTYSCRTRNNRAGARLSEHSVGRAIDVGGLWLGNGRKITIAGNWGKGTAGAFLRTIWKKACGPFKTVLGPGADRFHQDHLHLDTAYRNNAYCR